MRRAPYPQLAYRPHASASSRVASILLSLGATILIIVTLVQVGLIGPLPPEIRPMKLFNLEPPPPPPAARAPSVKARLDRLAAAPARAQRVPPLNMIILTPKDFAAADIATLPSQRTAVVAGDQADAGQDSSASNGPNGEKMYDVEWYRHPTHAELAPYMPASAPDSG